MHHKIDQMKNIQLIFNLCMVYLFLAGCQDKCETRNTYTFYEPVYKSLAEVRSEFDVVDPHPLKGSGKIYLYGTIVLINEVGAGVHVIDNSKPENPEFLKFINIPGNFDIAVKDNVLYADSYIDLLAIDISDISQIQLLHRVENAFPGYNTQFGFSAERGNVITLWEEKETVEISSNCRQTGAIIPMTFGIAMDAASPMQSSSISGPMGIGGSMARFAIQKQFLYAVDSYEMYVFSTEKTTGPEKIATTTIGWDIETIFPYKDKLFIGSSSGMFIYDIQDPSSPQYLSEFNHARACDPVVANDAYAFVTLRSGSACEGFTNQLDIIDIKDIVNPKLLHSVNLQNPHGLGLDSNTLFICEGEFGLKVFDISDINSLVLLKHVPTIQVHDVIPWQNTLLAIGEDGLYQYDYSDLDEIKLLSFLPFEL